MLSTLLFAVIAGSVSGLLAFHEARELQDNMLHDIAALVITGQLYSTPPVVIDTDGHSEHREDRIVIQRIDQSDNQILASLAGFGDGLQTLDVKNEGWRVLIKTVPATSQQSSWRFAVAQQTEERDEIAWQNCLSAFLPILVLAAVMQVLVNVVIHDRFKPLRSLATLVDQHDETRLEPLPDSNIPEEMVPFLRSINHLLARVRRVLTQQQRFVADAAHELRSPVTALSLLAENLKNATTEGERSQRQALLQEGLTRLRILVGQLLNFARLQSEQEIPLESIAFNGIVQQSIADLYPLAEEKGIDLGISRQETITVLDFSHSLFQLVTNAIDNAIRYTPPGGKIDISLFSQSGNAVLLVQDSGPGIPENELLQVLTAFYRTQGNQEPGTGLGLAICLEIARVLGGEITLSNRESGGLQFQYTQPLAAE
jgi:signal transduction histidine kinase